MIRISLILGYGLPFTIIYGICWLLYRYILHPEYKWSDRDNVCHENAAWFSFMTSLIVYIIGLLWWFDKITW